MPRISTGTDKITDNTNVPMKDDQYPWLDPEDKCRHMTDAEILQQKLNLVQKLKLVSGMKHLIMLLSTISCLG